MAVLGIEEGSVTSKNVVEAFSTLTGPPYSAVELCSITKLYRDTDLAEFMRSLAGSV